MDSNVYRPGAGKIPPLLVGRDRLVRDWTLQLHAVAGGGGRAAAEDLLLTGPRGVGKTCTLTVLADQARSLGYEVVNLQAVRDEPTMVASLIRQADAAIAADKGPWKRAKQALERFAGLQLGAGGFSAGVSLHPPAGGSTGAARDPESLAGALAALSGAVRDETGGRQTAGTRGGVMLTIDEIQVGDAREVALIAAVLQRLNVDHPDAAVVFAGTGLPHTMARLTEAGVTHPDRLFVETRIPLQLEEPDARLALLEPARVAGGGWEPAAVDAVLEASNRYPAHLQYFAQAVWRHAPGPVVDVASAAAAIPPAAETLTMRSLEPRWDALSEREAELVTAIAANGGRATAQELAVILGRDQRSWSRVRQNLIESGDIYAPRRGVLEITMPALARYALHEYPDLQSRSGERLASLDDMHQRSSGTLPPPMAGG
ncbi:AAA family ATPase [Nocardioides zeae]|uniref:ATP-binding protein n=1 Tax=Nocardioides zeae TaxID=1457234 RepID=A0A6P0HHY8_9ACTN|nr:AAA family ATPase [Nocardioides zeae]NEN78156.1 ATP-binding protein [Nocardioides zeae]